MKESKTYKISVRLSPEEKMKIDELCRICQDTVSNVIRGLIAAGYKNLKK